MPAARLLTGGRFGTQSSSRLLEAGLIGRTRLDEPPVTWHHGLMATWWAEFNEPESVEISFYRRAIEGFGQPALDLACGV